MLKRFLALVAALFFPIIASAANYPGFPTALSAPGTLVFTNSGYHTLQLSATGSGSGMTFAIQCLDTNSVWETMPMVVPSTYATVAPVTSASANGNWAIPVGTYFSSCRLNLTAISGGTETFAMSYDGAVNVPMYYVPSGGGGGGSLTITDGTTAVTDVTQITFSGATVSGTTSDGTVTITGGGSPGGTSGQIQYNDSGSFGGFTLAGDCTLTEPNIICTKTGGAAFVASATTDTTDASNISTGTLASGRMALGTSSAPGAVQCDGSTITCTAGVISSVSGGAGTVTSVGLTLPASTFSVSGSPVTTTGTLAGTFITQTANTVFAGPGSGSAATPGWRSLVAADIPSLSGSYCLITTPGCVLFNGSTATTQSAGDSSTKVATTLYVDSAVSAADPAVASYAASTANIAGTYSNGVAGVGATFTVTATGALALDGVSPAINSRVLLKNQTSAFQNGVYAVTVVGTTGVSPVLTRATDYDTPNNINNTGPVSVVAGTANAGTSWQLTSTVTTVGTDALTYIQFTYALANVATINGNNAFTGTNTATTQSQGDNSTKLATTAYADRTFSATEPGAVPLSGGGTTNFLRADGTWAAPSGGGAGPVMLYSQTSTGVTSIPLTSLINSSYSSYQLTIAGYVPSTSGTPLFMQFSQNNGSTWDSSNIYRVACFFALSNSTDGFCSSVGLGTSFDINGGPATAGGGAGACPIWLTNLSSTAVYKMVTGTCVTTGVGPIVSFAVNAMEYESMSAVNAIQIFVTTGTMTATVQLYGYP